MGELIGVYFVLSLFAGLAYAHAAGQKGAGGGTVFTLTLFLGPVIGGFYLCALPDRSGAAKSGEGEGTPSGRLRAVGGDLDEFRRAKDEGRLCPKCNRVWETRPAPGSKCPDCYARVE